MNPKLSVNLNGPAFLRNRRNLPWPDIVELGRIALNCGATGLTIHPRPDQRHIRYDDVAAIRALIDDEFPSAELNIEGYPGEAFLALVEANEPDQVTLVPDDPTQATSDHGWEFAANGNLLRDTVQRLKQRQIRVSLFCDSNADQEAILAARATGADRIELYTGPYGGCYDDPEEAARQVEILSDTATHAAAAGLGINAGHDLTVDNLPALAAAIPDLAEVSIGHCLTADALIHGMEGAVKRFLAALQPDQPR